MYESKYGKVLTVILTIVIIAIVGLLGFLGYEWYNKYVVNKDAENFVDDFLGEVNGNGKDTQDVDSDLSGVEDVNIQSDKNGKKLYKGYVVMGAIEIPVTGCKYPVLEKVTKKAIEVAVAVLYGAGLNQPGNTVISGHNYVNGKLFSNNLKIQAGDLIYITDSTGQKVTYSVYSKYLTSPNDANYMNRDTGGKREISLTTCTNDSSQRIIILARET